MKGSPKFFEEIKFRKILCVFVEVSILRVPECRRYFFGGGKGGGQREWGEEVREARGRRQRWSTGRGRGVKKVIGRAVGKSKEVKCMDCYSIIPLSTYSVGYALGL